MHQTKKGNQWLVGMNVHLGVDRESGLIHSLETTAANGHALTPAADLLHGEETVVDADAGHQGIEKRPEMQGRGIGFRTDMRPHPFRVIKQQFGFQKSRLRGMLKNRCKVNGLAALSNLFRARHGLLGKTLFGERCAYLGKKQPQIGRILGPQEGEIRVVYALSIFKLFFLSKGLSRVLCTGLLSRASLGSPSTPWDLTASNLER